MLVVLPPPVASATRASAARRASSVASACRPRRRNRRRPGRFGALHRALLRRCRGRVRTDFAPVRTIHVHRLPIAVIAACFRAVDDVRRVLIAAAARTDRHRWRPGRPRPSCGAAVPVDRHARAVVVAPVAARIDRSASGSVRPATRPIGRSSGRSAVSPVDRSRPAPAGPAPSGRRIVAGPPGRPPSRAPSPGGSPAPRRPSSPRRSPAPAGPPTP